MQPNGKHARTAVSVNALPINAAVEVDSIFEILLNKNYEIFTENSIENFQALDWDECNKYGNIFLSYNWLKLIRRK